MVKGNSGASFVFEDLNGINGSNRKFRTKLNKWKALPEDD